MAWTLWELTSRYVVARGHKLQIIFLQNAVAWEFGRQPHPGVCQGALRKVWIWSKPFCYRFCHTISVARPLQENNL